MLQYFVLFLLIAAQKSNKCPFYLLSKLLHSQTSLLYEISMDSIFYMEVEIPKFEILLGIHRALNIEKK